MKTTAPFYPDNIAIPYNDPQKYRSHYVDKGEKIVNKWLKDSEKALELNRKLVKSYRGSCVTGIRVGHCNNNHFFYKPVHCGKENCSFCGEDGSPAHQRRVNRVIDVINSWEAVSYFVITVPADAREWMKSKKALNDFRNFVRRKLKRDGFTTALFRWHWSGSCTACGGKKKDRVNCMYCHGTGAGNYFEPHLNILAPAGNTTRTTKGGKVKAGVQCYERGKHTLTPEFLEGWKQSLSDYFKREFGVISEGNFYHNFIGPRDPNKKRKVRHRVKYILRATLRDFQLAESLQHVVKGYRNTTHLGHWKKAAEEQPPAVCPCCGGALSWYGEPREVFYAPGKTLIEVQPGIFFVSWSET